MSLVTPQRIQVPSLARVALVMDTSATSSRTVRPRSGWTSLRVDRDTFARLQALRRSLPQLTAGLHASELPDLLPMVELLEMLSRAHAELLRPLPCNGPPGNSLARRTRPASGA